ncbi:Hypothetical protein CAP_4537 [Chondromyces apiculatus DSM 436]|uniref:Uncharacterized protein n=2 Tax=Chondromyces apiculatus TaxID=51 RepID=A0A017T548_9BACT|nr:Hypothetical protein CAP_4537 [Chondromyces apiculatus DSM 436]
MGLALVTGCTPPESPGSSDGGSTPGNPQPPCPPGQECGVVYWCTAPLPEPTRSVPDPEPLRFCNYDVISQEPGYRTLCGETQQGADDFCLSECMKAGEQNGYTIEETTFLCQNSAAVAALWPETDDPILCTLPNSTNISYTYAPEDMCPAMEGVDPEAEPPSIPPEQDLPHVFCHGTAEPTDPHGASFDFNEYLISYWLETWELDAWHYTPSYVLSDTNCGYKVYNILYEGLGLSDDQICQTMCSEHVAALELDAENPIDPEAARILHDNCDSFVAGSLCSAGPVVPQLLGPVTQPLTLVATLDMGTTYVTTTFSGQISYSTYDCAPGSTHCAMALEGLSLDLDASVSGVWASSTGNTSFSTSALSLDVPQSTTGEYSVDSGAFVLRDHTLFLDVDGAITVATTGSTSSTVPVDIQTTNTDAITGTIASDGSVTLSGSFAFGPGVTLHFGTPAPQ